MIFEWLFIDCSEWSWLQCESDLINLVISCNDENVNGLMCDGLVDNELQGHRIEGQITVSGVCRAWSVAWCQLAGVWGPSALLLSSDRCVVLLLLMMCQWVKLVCMSEGGLHGFVMMGVVYDWSEIDFFIDFLLYPYI